MSTQLIIDGATVYDSGGAPDFATALQAAWASSGTLDWTGGNVTVSAPIVLTAAANELHFTLNLNGAVITSAVTDPTKDFLTLQTTAHGVSVRHIRFLNGKLVGSGQERDGVVLSSRFGDAWIYNWYFDHFDVTNFGRDAIVLDGNVFEGWVDHCLIEDNKRHGINIWNEASGAIASAIWIDHSILRSNWGSGVTSSSETDWQQPYDLSVSNSYLLMNGRYGIEANMGVRSVINCGFENNGNRLDPVSDDPGAGIWYRNFLHAHMCGFSSGGVMPFGIFGHLNLAPDTSIARCRYQGYGNLTGQMKLAKFTGQGGVVLEGHTADDVVITGTVQPTYCP